MESVAGIPWNEWPVCRGIGGRNGLEYAATLAQIDAALERLHEGSYGYCLETGDEIGIRRLLANPTATLTWKPASGFMPMPVKL